MQVTKETWCIRELGSLSFSPTQEPGNEASGKHKQLNTGGRTA